MSDLLAALDALRERLTEIPQTDERRLQELKTEILGRKAGALTRILGALPSLEPQDRKTIGGAANALKREFESALAARERALKRAAGAATDQDLTMPGRARWTGGLHLVTQVVDEICEIFHELGFTRAVGPEAESERNNFYALNFPHDHPALDAQDSFYVGDGVVLRTHTSPVQIRTLEAYKPPIRVVIPGQVYRRDPFDPSHSPVFEQIEGLVVDDGRPIPPCASAPPTSRSPSRRRKWTCAVRSARAAAVPRASNRGGWRSSGRGWYILPSSTTAASTASATPDTRSAWAPSASR